MRKDILTAFLLACAAFARAEVPVVINYTGCLEGDFPGGAQTVRTNEAFYMEFRLYAEPGTGRGDEKAKALWGRLAPVALDGDGVFDVELSDSFGSPLPGSAATTNSLREAIARALDLNGGSSVWIGLTPESPQNAEIHPRQRVGAVVRAVQARNVRSVPDGFSVAKQLVVEGAGELEVTDETTLRGPATYAAARFEDDAPPDFRGGVTVTGNVSVATLANVTNVTAGEVCASSLDARGVSAVAIVAADAAAYEGTARLAVATGRLQRVECRQSTVGGEVTADTLVTPTLELQGGHSLAENEAWSPLGDMHVASNGITQTFFTDPAHPGPKFISIKTERSAVCTGSWKAPEDCLAYFQAYVKTLTGKACVQFYLGAAFSTNLPCASVCINGDSYATTSFVPVLMRKGETVHWAGYNDNRSSDQAVVEARDTRVLQVIYRSFGWLSEDK